ncbi:MAG: pitrilysin family protein [Deltaproteobacteria bacterium]|nr:pitrilysin family protein [Deltaproteobacteria bacterium]
MKKYLFILISFLTACGGGPKDLRDQVEKFRLENGLTVLLIKREGAPVFSGFIRIKVGAIEDPPGLSGMAHFFEHMAFKGTQTIGADIQNEFVRIYQRNGGSDLNATTSTDFTEYFVSLPSEKLPLWAYMESERLLHPVFREFEKEREVVIEERRMRYENDPNGKLYEHFIREALQGTPYGKSVIGTPPEILSITPMAAKAFREKNYIPSRMVVTLVGNFDADLARREIKKYFGRLAPGPKERSAAKPSHHTQGAREKVLSGSDEPRFYLGYPRPAYPHPDDAVFDAIQVLMCEGRTSRLFHSLVKEKNIASKVDCYSSLPGSRLDSVFAFYAYPIGIAPNRDLQTALKAELEKLKQAPPTGQELAKVKTKVKADLIWALKSNMGMAEWLSYFESLTGDWQYLYRFQELIEKMTPADLQRVARTYFVPENEVTVYLEKK